MVPVGAVAPYPRMGLFRVGSWREYRRQVCRWTHRVEIRYGHNEFLRDGSNGIPVVYIPAKSRHEIIPIVEKALPLLEGTRIGVATVVQHLHTLPETTRYLEAKGFR